MKLLYVCRLNHDQFQTFDELCAQYQHQIHLLGGAASYRYQPHITLHDRYKIGETLGRVANRLGFLDRAFVYRWTNLVKRIQPDLIHGIGAAFGGDIANNLRSKRPLIITAQGSDVYRFPFENERVFQQVKATLHHADHIHVLSPATAQHIERHFDINPAKITALHWGIRLDDIGKICQKVNLDEVRRQYSIPPHGKVIFAPRGLRPVFRPIGRLIEIIAPLMQQDETLVAVIMMHNKEASDLEAQIKADAHRYGVAQRVICIEEYLAYAEIIKLFLVSDIYISLAENDETSSATLEAMYLGTVPVVSRTPTYSDSFTHAKQLFFVDNDEPLQMRQQIAQILQNLSQIKGAMGAYNKKVIQTHYNRATTLATFQALYSGLLQHDQK